MTTYMWLQVVAQLQSQSLKSMFFENGTAPVEKMTKNIDITL